MVQGSADSRLIPVRSFKTDRPLKSESRLNNGQWAQLGDFGGCIHCWSPNRCIASSPPPDWPRSLRYVGAYCNTQKHPRGIELRPNSSTLEEIFSAMSFLVNGPRLVTEQRAIDGHTHDSALPNSRKSRGRNLGPVRRDALSNDSEARSR